VTGAPAEADPTSVIPSGSPRWFVEAVATPCDERRVEVAGCPVHYVAWGEPGRPGVLLVHGGAAHLHWWSYLAPFLLPDHHVVALDLSGHGDSGHRETYDADVWSDELVAVAADAGMERPVLVGHSMGGFVSIAAAARFPDRWSGAVIVDSPVRRPDPESVALQGRNLPRATPRCYDTFDEAVGRFRLVPDQPCENPWVVEHIARRSLRRLDDGTWRWKFDPHIFERIPRAIHEYLSQVRVRTCVLHGQLSAIVTPEVTDYMSELLGRSAPFVEIPQAHHHVLLDQPLALVAALRAILADWEFSVPVRPTA
jgi:pimeloyl-ACP methyl ester carboxylesterase